MFYLSYKGINIHAAILTVTSKNNSGRALLRKGLTDYMEVPVIISGAYTSRICSDFRVKFSINEFPRSRASKDPTD